MAIGDEAEASTGEWSCSDASVHTGLSEPTLFLGNLGKWKQLTSHQSWSTPCHFLGHYSSDELLHLKVSLECILVIKCVITRRLSL